MVMAPFQAGWVGEGEGADEDKGGRVTAMDSNSTNACQQYLGTVPSEVGE